MGFGVRSGGIRCSVVGIRCWDSVFSLKLGFLQVLGFGVGIRYWDSVLGFGFGVPSWCSVLGFGRQYSGFGGIHKVLPATDSYFCFTRPQQEAKKFKYFEVFEFEQSQWYNADRMGFGPQVRAKTLF